MSGIMDSVFMGGVFRFICRGKDGRKKWEDHAQNLTVNAGLEHILDVLFAGSTQINPWYVGLIDDSPTIASTDTVVSHAGWAEVTAYSGDRKEFVDARSNRSVSNSASKASFAITGTADVGGAFLMDSATASTGTLLCAAALSGSNRSVISGDTIELTYTFTSAAS
jgi:hypothetical protein